MTGVIAAVAVGLLLWKRFHGPFAASLRPQQYAVRKPVLLWSGRNRSSSDLVSRRDNLSADSRIAVPARPARKSFTRRGPDRTPFIRKTFQAAFILLNLWIGARFLRLRPLLRDRRSDGVRRPASPDASRLAAHRLV